MQEFDVAGTGSKRHDSEPSGHGKKGGADAQPAPRHDQRRQGLLGTGRREQKVDREADGLQQAPNDPDRHVFDGVEVKQLTAADGDQAIGGDFARPLAQQGPAASQLQQSGDGEQDRRSAEPGYRSSGWAPSAADQRRAGYPGRPEGRGRKDGENHASGRQTGSSAAAGRASHRGVPRLSSPRLRIPDCAMRGVRPSLRCGLRRKVPGPAPHSIVVATIDNLGNTKSKIAT